MSLTICILFITIIPHHAKGSYQKRKLGLAKTDDDVDYVRRCTAEMKEDIKVQGWDSLARRFTRYSQALYYNKEEMRLEKFRPFQLPSKEWLQQAAAFIQRKSEA